MTAAEMMEAPTNQHSYARSSIGISKWFVPVSLAAGMVVGYANHEPTPARVSQMLPNTILVVEAERKVPFTDMCARDGRTRLYRDSGRGYELVRETTFCENAREHDARLNASLESLLRKTQSLYRGRP